MPFLQLNQILSPNQYGFIPGRSTTDAIATLVDDVGLSHNNNNITLCTFIDFSKAFDTLNHNLIIKQLKSLNMNVKVVEWFNSYLTGRRHGSS